MSLVLKLMSGENGPDEDTRKGFLLHSGVKSVEFKRANDGTPLARVLFEDEPEYEEWTLEGNAYVMNQAGKTIAQFGAAPMRTPEEIRKMLEGDVPTIPVQFNLKTVELPDVAYNYARLCEALQVQDGQILELVGPGGRWVHADQIVTEDDWFVSPVCAFRSVTR